MILVNNSNEYRINKNNDCTGLPTFDDSASFNNGIISGAKMYRVKKAKSKSIILTIALSYCISKRWQRVYLYLASY